MADTRTTADWTAALETMSGQLDDLERRLDTDAWEDPPDLDLVHLDGPVPPELLPSARAVAGRLAALEQRIVAELDAARDALADVARRRTAARNYHRS